MSIFLPFRDARYLTVAILHCGERLAAVTLLRVKLDDELLLNLCVDLGARWKRVDEDAPLFRDHIEPRGYSALARLGTGDDERRELPRALAHVDDVTVGHPV